MEGKGKGRKDGGKNPVCQMAVSALEKNHTGKWGGSEGGQFK